jgi:GT2 family glycosyltransferase
MSEPRDYKSSGKVCILVLNWNNWKDTNDCLATLQEINYRNFMVVVLDNASTDGSADRIRARHPDVKMMQLERNFGFAKANNFGIRTALDDGAEYVWLLNNDTKVHPNALAAMVAKAEADPEIGAIGSALYSMANPECLQAWGGGHVTRLGRSHHFVTCVDDSRVDFITGASLLLRRQVIEEVGLLDENFFMFWEDADYCFRLRDSGWKLAVAGDSKVWHKQQGTIGKKSALLDTYFSQSAVHFFHKHAKFPFIPLWSSTALRLGKRIAAGNWKGVRAVWAGFRQARVIS